MSNKENSLIALHILDILKEYSDEENILTMNQIIDHLDHQGISRQRRSIGEIIEQLKNYGYDISTYADNSKGYFLISREFDMHEVRILIDSITSSKSITKKKSRELLHKIYELTNESSKRKLKKQIYMEDTIKCNNEQIYINIDNISSAIESQRKISFKYFDYNFNKEQVLRKSGEKYLESPINMALYNGYYYLITYNTKHHCILHYRIDRMQNIKIEEEPCDISYMEFEEYKNGFNVAKYVNKNLNMFGGEEIKKIEIKLHKSLLNMIIDEFGTDAKIYRIDEENFKFLFEASISDGLLSWVMKLGSKAEVLEPLEIRDRIKYEVEKLCEAYR